VQTGQSLGRAGRRSYTVTPELPGSLVSEATLAHLIAYTFTLGQSTNHTHTTHMSLARPEQEVRLYGHASFLRTQAVLP
jgi:hypothetical protein